MDNLDILALGFIGLFSSLPFLISTLHGWLSGTQPVSDLIMLPGYDSSGHDIKHGTTPAAKSLYDMHSKHRAPMLLDGALISGDIS